MGRARPTTWEVFRLLTPLLLTAVIGLVGVVHSDVRGIAAELKSVQIDVAVMKARLGGGK